MDYTINNNLKKPLITEAYNVQDFNDNADVIDALLGKIANLSTTEKTNLVAAINELKAQNNTLDAYAVASGTNTCIATIDGYTLVEGKSIKIKFTNENTGVSTLNINGLGAKSIRKGNGSTLSSGNIKAGQIVNLVYTGSVFQLLGEGGEYGTATPSDVLSGKTIGTDEGIQEGTIPDRGPAAAETINLTSQNQEYTIALGFHSGLRKIKAVISGLVASVIKAGTIVGGVEGNFTGDANATAGQMLKDVIAYVKGNKIVGTILSKGAQIFTPGTTNQVISANQYLTGDQTIAGSPNFLPENIKYGVNMWGKVGTLKPAEPIANIGNSEMNGLILGIGYISNLSLITNQIVNDAFIFRISTSSNSTVKLKVIGSVRDFSTIYNDGDIIDLIAQRAIVLFNFIGGGVQVVSYTGTAPACHKYITK